MSRLVLASGSFLKNFIMEKTNLEYEVIEAGIDESIFDYEPIAERVQHLAEEKCRVVATQAPDAIVIAADTLTCDATGRVFSKPEPGTDLFAAAMDLSGKTIGVHTGCSVIVPGKQLVSTATYTTLTYQNFVPATLKKLTKNDDASIRSGALGIFFDAPGFTLIERIEGSYTGAYGLPMEFIYAQIQSILD